LASAGGSFFPLPPAAGFEGATSSTFASTFVGAASAFAAAPGVFFFAAYQRKC